jgi:hypothetical protein
LGEPDYLGGDGAEKQVAGAAETAGAHHDLMGTDLTRDAVDGLGRETDLSPRDGPRLCFTTERYRSMQGSPGLPRSKPPVDLDRHDCGNVRYV